MKERISASLTRVMRKNRQKQTKHRFATSDIRQVAKFQDRKPFLNLAKEYTSELALLWDKITSILGLIDWCSIQLWAALNGSSCVVD